MHNDWITQLIANWVFIIEACIIFMIVFAWHYGDKREMDNHRFVVRMMVTVQTLMLTWMIFSIFLTSYGKQFWPHAIVGTLAYLFILYTYLSMDHKLPKKFSVPVKYRLKWMKTTAVVWSLSIGFGLFMYLIFPT